MSGMGKPGNNQTWIFNTSLNSWISGSTGSGSDNFSTQAIITRLSGSSTNSRIDALSYVRLSGSISQSLFSQYVDQYTAINMKGNITQFCNSNSQQEYKYSLYKLNSTYYRMTGSISLVTSSIILEKQFLSRREFPILQISGNFINLIVTQSSGINDWSSDLKFHVLNTDNTTKTDDKNIIIDSSLMLYLDAANINSYPATGSIWYDLSENKKHATLFNSPFYKTDNGGILTFSSSLSHYAQGGPLGSAYPTWTMSMWVKMNANATGNPALFTDVFASSLSNYTFYGNGTTQFSAGFYNGTWRLTTPGYTLPIGSWTNIVATFNGTTIRMYANASEVGSNTPGVSSTGGSIGYRIGRRWDIGEYVNSDIAVVKLYNRALTLSEISFNYDMLKGRYGL